MYFNYLDKSSINHVFFRLLIYSLYWY